MKKFLKNPRILMWLFFIVASIIVISPNPNARGYVIVSVENTSSLLVGDMIYGIDGQPASPETLGKFYSGIITIDTSKGPKYVSANGSLGVLADPVPTSRIRFGLDITGGVRAVIVPNDTSVNIDDVINKLRSRINVYGLRETVLRPVYHNGIGSIEVSIAGGTKDELQNLITSQGKFDARIPMKIQYSNGVANIILDKNYQVDVKNDSIQIDGKTVLTGGSFNVAGIYFLYNGNSQNFINVTSTVFTGSDIRAVLSDPQRSRIDTVQGGFQWMFGVQLSTEAAQKFAWVTQNINVQGTQLESPIMLYLDDGLMDTLTIDASLKGKTATEISINGFASAQSDALQSSKRLQSILRSGALPTSVQIAQLETLSPTLGASFLLNALAAGAAAIIGIVVVVSLRYKKPKLVMPMVIISLSEILIVFGLSVLIGWTIDLPSMAGIIASVGTGIDSQIIILDRALRKHEDRLETLRQKLKNAFFVVFGAAGTVIAAMLPLLFLDILRGFAIVTILGVLVGVLIARPAYGVIIESMRKED